MVNEIEIVNRHGISEPVSFDKITARLKNIAMGKCAMASLPSLENIQYTVLTQRTSSYISDGMKTYKIDLISSRLADEKVLEHPEWRIYSSRIFIDNMHKQLLVSGGAMALYSRIYDRGVLCKEFIENIKNYIGHINFSRDFNLGYNGMQMLVSKYLLKDTKGILETPNMMFMRVAVTLGKSHSDTIQLYKWLSTGKVMLATPMLYSCGSEYKQLASCFLMHVSDDITSIARYISDIMFTFKYAGGIGSSISTLRCSGDLIKSTGGTTNSPSALIHVLDKLGKYIDQGGNKRNGTHAVYIEPWHSDFLDILATRDINNPTQVMNIFTATWLPDLFMCAAEAGDDWYLFNPRKVPLDTVHDTGMTKEVYAEMKVADNLEPYALTHPFSYMYFTAVREGIYEGRIPAMELLVKIGTLATESGKPYVLFKDTCNRNSNHNHLGTIKCSNLCSEIIQYSSEKETAVCNLASICLGSMVVGKEFIWSKLDKAVRGMVRHLNTAIDITTYPTERARKSNLRHRPIGIGVQGLADAFIALGIPFQSQEAIELNIAIFKQMYISAFRESVKLYAEGKYDSYYKFSESLLGRGILHSDIYQYRLPGINYSAHDHKLVGSEDILREELATAGGCTNSMCIALMPTESTSYIMENSMNFEPIPGVVYKVTKSGTAEQLQIHPQFAGELLSRNMWTEEVLSEIRNKDGLLSETTLSNDLKALYESVWEIPVSHQIKMMLSRQPWVDQSQSFNLHLNDNACKNIVSIYMYLWKNGAKTGSYYTRTRSGVAAQKMNLVCTRESVEIDGCESCGA